MNFQNYIYIFLFQVSSYAFPAAHVPRKRSRSVDSEYCARLKFRYSDSERSSSPTASSGLECVSMKVIIFSIIILLFSFINFYIHIF